MGGPNAHAAFRPSSRPDGANSPPRRALQAGSRTEGPVPAAEGGHLAASSHVAAAPFLAVRGSTGASSQARTSKKDEKIVDKRHPLGSSALER